MPVHSTNSQEERSHQEEKICQFSILVTTPIVKIKQLKCIYNSLLCALCPKRIYRSKRIVTELGPNSQISSRNEIFEHDTVNEEDVKEDAQKMDEIMRRLMGGSDDNDEEEAAEGK